MSIVSYCNTCKHEGIVCVNCLSIDGVPSMYQPKGIKDYPLYLDCSLVNRRCKEDCYWYEEEHDMGATIPFCKLRKGLDPIEYEDCAKCEKYHSKYKRTNADRIRSMTDEELADVIAEGFCSGRLDKCDNYKRCTDCTLDWLKEEVKT